MQYYPPPCTFIHMQCMLHLSKNQNSSLTVLVNGVGPNTFSLAVGPHMSETAVDATAGGWPIGNPVCSPSNLSFRVVNATQKNILFHFTMTEP